MKKLIIKKRKKLPEQMFSLRCHLFSGLCTFRKKMMPIWMPERKFITFYEDEDCVIGVLKEKEEEDTVIFDWQKGKLGCKALAVALYNIAKNRPNAPFEEAIKKVKAHNRNAWAIVMTIAPMTMVIREQEYPCIMLKDVILQISEPKETNKQQE